MSLRRIRSVASFLGVALFVLALFVVRRELEPSGYREIAAALRSFPATALLTACLVTLASFGILAGHDALAVRYADRAVGALRTTFASFVGYAFGQTLGSPLLGGAPVRHRLYAGWGLSTVDIARVDAFNAITAWIGLTVALGGTLLFEATRVAAAVPVPAGLLRGAGVLGLAAALAYVARALGSKEPLRLFSWDVPLPSPGLVGGQVAAGVADVGVAATVLWVLLPAGHGLAFPHFVAVFAAARILGDASRVPGGLGVFEATVLLLLPETMPGGPLAAALVAYRIVYYVLPLLLAAGCLGLYELRERREALERTVDAFGHGISAAAPVALSGIVFLAGVLLLFTGSIPVGEERLSWLGHLAPLPVVELTHFLGSLVGAGLLVLAWRLRQRLEAAYRLTLVLLAAGAVVSVVRGLVWVQAVALLACLLALLPARREFFRKASLAAEGPSRQWLALVAVTLVGTVWLGLFAYRRIELSAELWWEFTLRGDAPRFLRASVGVAVFFLAYGFSRLLRPSVPRELTEAPEALPEGVDAVVSSSDRAHAALVYLKDKQVLPSRSRDAFVMYAVEGRSWITLGDPLGAVEDYDELIWRFRKLAFRHGGWPVFYQARPERLSLYVETGLSAAKLGEEGYVPLEDFGLEGGARKGLRRTVKKVEERGADFEILPDEAVGSVIPTLREISDAWLREKSAREKGFSLGFFDEDYLRRFPVAVLRVGGEVVAFANVLASGGREELTSDLMRYRPEAPPSAMEYIFIQLMLWGSANGYRRFSVGMAPLSGLETRPLDPLWNRLGSIVYRYGGHFYNFQGLRAYKEKFRPVWEPRYLVSPGGLAFPRILANVATLIGGGVRGVVGR